MKILTPEQLADRWGVSKGTLANWRMTEKKGPKYIKNFGRVFYRSRDVVKYERQNAIVPKR